MAQQINLYDPRLRKQHDWFSLTNVAAAGLLLLGAVAALGFVARSELGTLRNQSAALETQLKTLRDQVTLTGQQVAARKPDPRFEQDIAAIRLMLSGRGEVLTLLQQQMTPGAQTPYSEYLRGLARQNLSGLRLVGFQYQGADGAMEIRGQTLNPALIPDYIRRLNKEPAFQGRAFAALQLNEGKPAEATGKADSRTSPAARVQYHEFKLIPKFDSKTSAQPNQDAASSIGRAQ